MVENEGQEKESSTEGHQDGLDGEEKTKSPVDQDVAPEEGEHVDVSLDDLVAERDQLKDQLLRAMAETENIRRRNEREMHSARKYGHTSFARDLVGAVDNLARAIEATDKSEASEGGSAEALQGLIKGIELSWTEIQSIMEKNGIKRIDPVGEKFDYNLHQAMFELPTEEHAPGTVVEVVQHGYVLHERLLRPAMVGVSKAPDGSAKEVDSQA
jgi:molecular chaperone GrpE